MASVTKKTPKLDAAGLKNSRYAAKRSEFELFRVFL